MTRGQTATLHVLYITHVVRTQLEKDVHILLVLEEHLKANDPWMRKRPVNLDLRLKLCGPSSHQRRTEVRVRVLTMSGGANLNHGVESDYFGV